MARGRVRLSPIAAIAALAQALFLPAGAGHAQISSDAAAKAIERLLSERQKQISDTVVAPCRASAEKLVGAERERQKTCGCYATEAALRQSLDTLTVALNQALARCEVKGLDAQLADLEARKAAATGHLRELVTKFQQQAAQYEQLGKDSEAGMKDTITKIGDVGLSFVAGELITMQTDEMIRRLDVMVAKAVKQKNPRAVTTTQLAEFVAQIKHELKGKSKAEAKAIILERLDEAKLATEEIGAWAKLTASTLESAASKADGPPSSAWDHVPLVESYGMLMISADSALKAAESQVSRSAAALAKALPVLGFLPDAIDVTELLGRATVIGQNVEGLEALRKAAQADQTRYGAELKVLIARRNQIEAQRTRILPQTRN